MNATVLCNWVAATRGTDDFLKTYYAANKTTDLNCIRHALVISENRLLSLCDLGLDRRYKSRMLKTLEEARVVADCESIITSLRFNNNMSRAAETLGISRVSLYRFDP